MKKKQKPFVLPSSFRRRRQWQPTPVLLPWKIPWMGEPGRLQSMGSHRVGHDCSDLAVAAAAVWVSSSFSNIYLCSWLYWILVAAHRIFGLHCSMCFLLVATWGFFSWGVSTLSCSMRDLVPWPVIKHGPPALGALDLRHWTTRVSISKTTLCVYQDWADK